MTNATGEKIPPVKIVCQRYGVGWLAWLTTRPDRIWKGRTSAEALGKVLMMNTARIFRFGLGSIETVNHDGQTMRILHPEAAPDSRAELREWEEMTSERKD